MQLQSRCVLTRRAHALGALPAAEPLKLLLQADSCTCWAWLVKVARCSTSVTKVPARLWQPRLRYVNTAGVVLWEIATQVCLWC